MPEAHSPRLTRSPQTPKSCYSFEAPDPEAPSPLSSPPRPGPPRPAARGRRPWPTPLPGALAPPGGRFARHAAGRFALGLRRPRTLVSARCSHGRGRSLRAAAAGPMSFSFPCRQAVHCHRKSGATAHLRCLWDDSAAFRFLGYCALPRCAGYAKRRAASCKNSVL